MMSDADAAFFFPDDDPVGRCRDMVKRHPQVPELRVSLAGALWSTSRTEDALAEMREVVRQMPEADAFVVFGKMLAMAGRWEEAMQALERATTLEPENAGAHLCAGNLLLHGGRRHAARAEWTQALGLEHRLREACPLGSPEWETRRETDIAREAQDRLDTYPVEDP